MLETGSADNNAAYFWEKPRPPSITRRNCNAPFVQLIRIPGSSFWPSIHTLCISVNSALMVHSNVWKQCTTKGHQQEATDNLEKQSNSNVANQKWKDEKHSKQTFQLQKEKEAIVKEWITSPKLNNLNNFKWFFFFFPKAKEHDRQLFLYTVFNWGSSERILWNAGEIRKLEVLIYWLCSRKKTTQKEKCISLFSPILATSEGQKIRRDTPPYQE